MSAFTRASFARSAGLGLAYVMDCSVRAHLAEGRLVRVLEPFCGPFPGFHLYPSRAHLAPKLQAFISFFRHAPRRARRKART